LDALLPALYLRSISTGDFQKALTALLGKDAPNLSPAVISRLNAEWKGEYARWQQRDRGRDRTSTCGPTASSSSCRLAWKIMECKYRAKYGRAFECLIKDREACWPLRLPDRALGSLAHDG
jgi:hypothetical protein